MSLTKYWQKMYKINDISDEEAIKAMTTTYRLHQRPDHGWGAYAEPQMWYRNEWWWLARTDLCDDVCTGRVENWPLDEWIKYYKDKCAKAYGARLHRYKHDDFPTFAIIDAMTDG